MPSALGFLAPCLLLCYYLHRVTCIDRNRLQTSVAYIKGLGITEEQYAYAIKMTRAECDNLDNNVMANVLHDDPADDIISYVEQGYIYKGARIVFARPFYHKQGKYWDHAEYRLLVPEDSEKSPVQQLLETEPRDCVLFFSLRSPCLQYCLDPEGDYKIIPHLNVFAHIDNNYKAFTFSTIYKERCCTSRDALWNGWKLINDQMPFFRCGNQGCIECFAGGQQSRDSCLAGGPTTRIYKSFF